MRQRPTIKLRLGRLSFHDLYDMGQKIHNGLAASADYPVPVPSLLQQQSDNVALEAAIAAWSVKGRRGSHADRIALQDAGNKVKLNLTRLAQYVQNTTPYDESKWIPVGFESKNSRHPQGRLPAVVDLHQVIGNKIQRGEVKLKWKKPLTVSVYGNVKLYKIYRNMNADLFEQATLIATTTKTTFTDTPSGSPMAFYWVRAVNSDGDGVISDGCMVHGVNFT
jgi:hypothetical protein